MKKTENFNLLKPDGDENYNIQRQKMMERVKVEAEIEQGVEEVLIDLLKDWQ